MKDFHILGNAPKKVVCMHYNFIESKIYFKSVRFERLLVGFKESKKGERRKSEKNTELVLLHDSFLLLFFLFFSNIYFIKLEK